MSKKIDIIVVGGGMVGLAMTAALAKTGLKILLIEKQDLNATLDSDLLKDETINDQSFETRVSAISPGNRQFLIDLKAWQNIPSQRQAIYDQMKVWDGDGSGKIEFSAAKIAQPDLGVIVENKVIQAAILKRIKSFGNVEYCFGIELEELKNPEDSEYALVRTNDGCEYKSRLVIGADGANSVVREKLGIDLKQSEYNQIAFVANVKTEKSHQNTAWQRFTPYGPVAFLPLANPNLCSVVWSLDSDKAEAIKNISKDEFAKKIQYAFESKLGEVTAVSEVFGFPLIKRHCQRYLSNRVALIGDAAHTIHPLAGQGVNLGFRDVMCLSKLIIKLISQQRDFGIVESLRSFERERKTENLLMQNAMSGFKNLFANQSLPVTLFRNFAMSALDKIPAVKEIMIKKAMGI